MLLHPRLLARPEPRDVALDRGQLLAARVERRGDVWLLRLREPLGAEPRASE